MHPFKTFDVFPDFIRIDKRTLERPNYMSYEQWIDFWDFEKDRKNQEEISNLYKELNDKDDEISGLKEEIDSLVREISDLEGEIDNLERELNG